MQYIASNRMYVFKNFSGGDIPGTPFGAPSKILAARRRVSVLYIVNSTVADLDFWKKALVSTC